jgi:carbon storage regulator
MLVLSRRIGEEIVIDGQVRVIVKEVRGGRVRLGVCAPSSMRVDRQEVHDRRAAEACSSPTNLDACPSFSTGEEEAHDRCTQAT